MPEAMKDNVLFNPFFLFYTDFFKCFIQCCIIGFIVDDSSKRYYFTSDTLCFDNDYKCDVVFVPVCNHGLVMGPFEAAAFSKEHGASLIIPVHYDNPSYPTDLEKVKEEFSKLDLNLKVLNIKESVEI